MTSYSRPYVFNVLLPAKRRIADKDMVGRILSDMRELQMPCRADTAEAILKRIDERDDVDDSHVHALMESLTAKRVCVRCDPWPVATMFTVATHLGLYECERTMGVPGDEVVYPAMHSDVTKIPTEMVLPMIVFFVGEVAIPGPESVIQIDLHPANNGFPHLFKSFVHVSTYKRPPIPKSTTLW